LSYWLLLLLLLLLSNWLWRTCTRQQIVPCTCPCSNLLHLRREVQLELELRHTLLQALVLDLQRLHGFVLFRTCGMACE
jgi:hypothetical protein